MKKYLSILIPILILVFILLFVPGLLGKCPESCDDGNPCTKDFCSRKTGFQCKHEPIIPCCGNELCEEGEDFSSCPEDCPNCDDDNVCTDDSYDYQSQSCIHKEIVPCCGNAICEEEENVLSCLTDCKEFIFQPHPLKGIDALVPAYTPGVKPGSEPNLFIKGNYYAYIKFNLDEIPRKEDIVEAKLGLFTEEGGEGRICAYRILENWDEEKINVWNIPEFLPDPYIAYVKQYWTFWDLTTLMQKWINKDIENYGVVLKTCLGGKGGQFHSSDSAKEEFRPKLIIKYK